MTSANKVARHRAEAPKTSSLAVIAKAVSNNAGGVGRQAAVIAAASGLVLTSGIAANAADTNVDRESTSTSTLDVQSVVQATIAADSTVAISYERPVVTTVEAPAPVVVEEAPAKVEAKVENNEATAVTANAAPAANATVAVSNATPRSGSSRRIQRPRCRYRCCSLRPARCHPGLHHACDQLPGRRGINFHDWPAGYLSLGRTVSAAEAQPGDLATTPTAVWPDRPTSLSTSATAKQFTVDGTDPPRHCSAPTWAPARSSSASTADPHRVRAPPLALAGGGVFCFNPCRLVGCP